jgi:hypothetical protein
MMDQKFREHPAAWLTLVHCQSPNQTVMSGSVSLENGGKPPKSANEICRFFRFGSRHSLADRWPAAHARSLPHRPQPRLLPHRDPLDFPPLSRVSGRTTSRLAPDRPGI